MLGYRARERSFERRCTVVMNDSRGAAVVQHLMNDLQGPTSAINGATIQHHLKRLHDEGGGEFGYWQFVKYFETGEKKAL